MKVKERFFVLAHDGKTLQETDVDEWLRWFLLDQNRRLAEDDIGGYNVKTVCSGLPGALFCTMVTKNKNELVSVKHTSTHEAAMEAHNEACSVAKDLRSSVG